MFLYICKNIKTKSDEKTNAIKSTNTIGTTSRVYLWRPIARYGNSGYYLQPKTLKMNIKDILIRKAEYPVRLIATERKEWDITPNNPFVLYEIGDEVGIEAIDFSSGTLRVCNKSEIRLGVFEICYDKETGDIIGGWEFKPKN